MKIPFLSSFFRKKSDPLTIPDSILVKKLKSITEFSELSLYKDIIIYHHTKNYLIPLMLLDTRRGIYLFERKDWSYDDLKNSKIEKAENQNSSKDTLSYQNTQTIIDKKFNELIHHDSVPIFNYLLMENLNADEYEHLDESFKELLPKNRVIFSDSEENEIIQKLEYCEIPELPLPAKENIIGNLLIQHTILNDDSSLKLCTKEQIKFIDENISGFEVLNSDSSSDKSSVLLLKVVLEKLKNPDKKYIIIKPTVLACDILKKRLLEIVERAIIEIDLSSIMILTPIDLINMHLRKLKRETIVGALTIDESLMRKNFSVADLIMCDDSNLMPENFIQYLIHIQSKSNLVLVNSDIKEARFTFEGEFKTQDIDILFHKANPHAKALQLISKLLQSTTAEGIVVVSNSLSKEKLNDDLEYFIKDKALLLDSSENLINQNFDSLLLLTYADTNALKAEHIIMLDLCFTSQSEIEYALGMATSSVDIIYEDDCPEIENLRIKYESNYERDGVEEETLT